ncbi:MAG: DMT family transporter [Anaerolineae bacterium]
MATIQAVSAPNRWASIALPALITGAVAIGFSAIFVRLSEVGPIATAFWRMAIAFPAFWLWMQVERRQQPQQPRPATRTDFVWLAAVGLFFAGDLITWHLSINFTSVANSVLLANFAPIFVTAGGWLFFRQRVTGAFIGGMLLAITGAAMLVGASFQLSGQRLLGDVLGLTTAVFYGGYILSVKRIRGNLSTATVMAWGAVITAVLLLPVALWAEGCAQYAGTCPPGVSPWAGLLPATLTGWLVLAGLALFSHTGGQGLITFALAHLPASFSSVTLLLQPVLSALFAWLLLGESLTPWQMAGGLIVLTGIFIARRASRLA